MCLSHSHRQSLQDPLRDNLARLQWSGEEIPGFFFGLDAFEIVCKQDALFSQLGSDFCGEWNLDIGSGKWETDLDGGGIVREETCFDSGTECVEKVYHPCIS